MTLLDRIRADVNGARILADWLGEGGEPVSEQQAADRAWCCDKCEENQPSPGFESTVGKAIVEQMAVSLRIGKVMTDGEFKPLDTCRICRCYLKLKVWVPWKHLKNFTDPAKFPQNCWIPKEATADKAQQHSTDEERHAQRSTE